MLAGGTLVFDLPLLLFLSSRTPTPPPANTDLEWKVVYVSSAEDAGLDQELENVMVGPVPMGINKFVLQAPAPSVTNIPNQDLIGVTVILVTCSFMDHEFVRIGYYVNNEYNEPYEEGTLPDPIEIGKLFRNILAAEPRVTRFNIDWTGGNAPVGSDEAGAVGGHVGGENNATGAGDDDDGLDLDKICDVDEEDEEDDDDGAEDDAEVDLGEEEDDEAETSAVEMVLHTEDSMDVHVMQTNHNTVQ